MIERMTTHTHGECNCHLDAFVTQLIECMTVTDNEHAACYRAALVALIGEAPLADELTEAESALAG